MLQNKLPELITQALKSGDQTRLSTLKLISAAITNAKIAKRPDKLTQEDELKVIKSEAKKRLDAIEIYKKAGKADRAKQEQNELSIIKEFLPEEISDEQLEEIVAKAVKSSGASSPADMGKAMGAAMKAVSGQADGNRVSTIVRKILSQ